MTTSNYVYLKDSKFINISGEDRCEFLQNLITNDINKCDSINPIYACLLTPQGKFIADFFVIENNYNFLIEIHNKFITDFYNKLKIYKLSSKIEINIIDNLTSLVLLKKNNNLQFENDVINFVDPRSDKIGTKIIFNVNKFDDVINTYDLNEISSDIYRELLIKNLIPYSSVDLLQNKSLLLENNFEKINAIDWQKGCYVGQEITARMKYRALLKKSIRAVEIISGSVNPGNQIANEKNKIGEIISSFNNLAIAMLKIKEANDAFDNKKILKTESASLKIIN